MSPADPDELRRNIERAYLITSAWPVWKQGVLDRSSKPTKSNPRKPINNHQENSMSEPINQPGATTASIPLPKGYVLDKGEQPRRPKHREKFVGLSGDIHVAQYDFSVSVYFIITRSTPDDSWWPEWLLADCAAMTANGSWVAFESEPSIFHGGAWSADGCRTLFLPEWLFNLPDWPTDRWQESKIMNPHKRGEQ